MPGPYQQAMMSPMDAAKMQAAAEMLQRREALATIGQLSGDPVLSKFGAGQAQQIQGQRKNLRQALEAARKWQSVRPSGMPGYMIRGGELEEVPGYWERQAEQKEADRQTRLRIAMERAQNPNEWYAREMWKRSMGTPSQMAEARKTLAYLPELQNLAQELQPEAVEIPAGWEAAADFAREYLPLGSAAAAGLERQGLNPASMRWLERGRQAESDIIRLASGLAVTGFELENVKKWSPWAANISKKQRTDRIRNIYNKLGREATAIGGAVWEDRPEGAFVAVEESTPTPQMTPGQMPVVPETGPGQTVTPGQVSPGPVAPPQRTPQTMPKRPDGITDEEWRMYLQLEGLGQ